MCKTEYAKGAKLHNHPKIGPIEGYTLTHLSTLSDLIWANKVSKPAGTLCPREHLIAQYNKVRNCSSNIHLVLIFTIIPSKINNYRSTFELLSIIRDGRAKGQQLKLRCQSNTVEIISLLVQSRYIHLKECDTMNGSKSIYT